MFNILLPYSVFFNSMVYKMVIYSLIIMINKVLVLLLVLLVAGCTSSSNSVEDVNGLVINETGSVANETNNVTNETSSNLIVDESSFSDVICSSLDDVTMQVTALSEDTVVNAKAVSVCSVNHDVMNSVNHKYYTFTLSEPASVYAMVDGFNAGAWQVGIIDNDWVDGVDGKAVVYSANLSAGTYTLYVRLTNALGSTCTGSDCCFELQEGSTCYWISGVETDKLGFRLKLSTSELMPDNSLEVIASSAPLVDSCTAFNSKTVGIVSHDSVGTAYPVSMCDSLADTFIGTQYQYYILVLSSEKNVRITLDKPEGNWQVGVDGYGWQESSSIGSESIVYTGTLPAGEHKVWVMVSNMASLSGSDWSCRQVVVDGTCYWINGLPPDGTYYLVYTITFDSQ